MEQKIFKIGIINGPNLNILGQREPSIYGHQNFESFLFELKKDFPNIYFEYYQSNHEGYLIDALHACMHENFKGIIINPGGFSHTSIAIADAITAINIPTIEVHISNIYARESYRHQSITGSKCKGVISGLGLKGYALATYHLLHSN
jgi:3-dehydroquinate dehydratase-2